MIHKRQAADVICQHKTDGSIIPIKIRISDGDGEYQTYVIKRYKGLKEPGEYVMPNTVPCTSHTWAFECVIAVFGVEKHIHLFYNAYDNIWIVTI